jgi:predicted nucleotidyltransferase
MMDSATAIDRLNGHKASLQALGLSHVSLFGSTARGEATASSDVDLAVTLDEAAGIDLFRFAAISQQVARMLDAKVDLVVEPARNPRMQAQIDRDRRRVY